MKLLILSKFAWVSVSRRVLRQVSTFPLLALLGVIGVALLWIGLAQVYAQSTSLLVALPESYRSSTNLRVFNTIVATSFLLAYLLLALLREPARDQQALVVTPIQHGLLWLGVNNVALFLIALGITISLLPLVAAAVQTSWPKPPQTSLNFFIAAGISLCFALRSILLAVCVERIVKALPLSLPYKIKAQPLLGVLFPLAITALFGLPLTYSEPRYVDPLASSLARLLSNPSPLQAASALIWAIVPMLLALSLAYGLLNRTFELPPNTIRSSLLSRHMTPTGNVYHQFVVAEVKRLLRLRAYILAHLLLIGALVVLGYGLRQYFGVGSLLAMLALQISPYVGFGFPLITLHEDLPSEWFFRSIPLHRAIYLGLKLLAATLLSLGLTGILIAAIVMNGVLPAMMTVIETVARTLGMAGLAFLIGGIFKRIMGDVGGQVFIAFLGLVLGAGLQYGMGQVASAFSPWVAGAMGIAVYGMAPFVVLAWEVQSGTEV